MSASAVALLGGALWVLRWLVVPGDDPLGLTLRWAGLGLVLLAASVAATGLVTGDVVALRLLVTVAAPLLAWSVIEFFRPQDVGWYDGGWGLVALAAGAWGLWRGRGAFAPGRPPTRRAHVRRAHARGAHAR